MGRLGHTTPGAALRYQHAAQGRDAEIAKRLETTEEAVATAVHRLRRRYRAILREEIAATVADPAEIEDEIRELFRALRS